MSKVIEIKAMSKEEAIARALKILEAKKEQVVQVTEKQKSKSFLGLFKKEGIYAVEIKKKNENFIQNKKNDINDILEEKKEEMEINHQPIIEEKVKLLLDYIDLNLNVKVKKINDYHYLVNLSGEDKGIIIGKKGKTLNSFETILKSMIRECKIEVDVDDFKEKRIETLRKLGKKMAERVLKTGKTVILNPMSARERKIIHEVVNNYDELDTFSEGREPKRYIVIRKKRK